MPLTVTNGLWHSPYVKIYPTGGAGRLAEVSNYPRAYKDKEQHVYLVDTPFTVTETDLNFYLNDIDEVDKVYKDRKGASFRVGEQASHLIGDLLPGEFPRWLESEELELDNSHPRVFLLDSLPPKVLKVSDVQVYLDRNFVSLEEVTQSLQEQAPNGIFRLPLYVTRASDRLVMRFKYKVRL